MPVSLPYLSFLHCGLKCVLILTSWKTPNLPSWERPVTEPAFGLKPALDQHLLQLERMLTSLACLHLGLNIPEKVLHQDLPLPLTLYLLLPNTF